jgi:hypothetical protein
MRHTHSFLQKKMEAKQENLSAEICEGHRRAEPGSGTIFGKSEHQGDQIGRILARWMTVNFGQLLLKLQTFLGPLFRLLRLCIMKF